MNTRSGGFTMIELIVTTVILGLIVLAVTSLLTTVSAAQRNTLYLESATRAAERQVESMRNTTYTSLTPGTTINFTTDLPDTLLQPRNATAKISEPIQGIKRVDITVTYHDTRSSRTVKLSSLIGELGVGSQ